MLSEKEKNILNKIVGYSRRIEEKMKEVSFSSFESDLDTREIICFNLFQIGELCERLDDSFAQSYPALPWKDIKGMRDVIGHGYGTIDVKTVYGTVISDIPELRRYCEEILK